MVTHPTHDVIPDLISLKKACEILKCHANTLRQWDKNGVLKAVRFGTRKDRRYKREDILKILHSRSPEIPVAATQNGLDFFEREAQTAIERISRLQLITAAISRAASVNDIGDIILTQGLAACGSCCGVIGLINKETASLEIVQYVGFKKREINKLKSLPLTDALPVTDAARVGDPIFIETLEECRARYPLTLTFGQRIVHESTAIIPMIANDSVLGIIGFYFEQPITFRRNDISFMLALGRQCGQAFDRARLFESEKLARATAESLEKQVRNVLENMHDAFISTDRNWRVLYLNQKAAEWLQIKQEDIIGKPLRKIYAPSLYPDYYKKAEQSMSERVGSSYEGYNQKLHKWFDVRIYPSPEGITTFFRDISERKFMQEHLYASEKRYRTLIEKSTDAIALVDKAGLIVYASPASTQVLGYQPKELQGKVASQFVHPDDRQGYLQLRNSLLNAPFESRKGIFRTKHSDGTFRWIEGTATNLLEDTGISAIVLNYRDITDRKVIEEKLQQSESRFRLLLEHMQEYAVILTDTDGQIIDWNAGATELFGYNKDEVVGHNSELLYSPQDIAQHIPEKERSMAMEETRVISDRWLQDKKGATVFVYGITTALYGGSNDLQGFAKIMHNVTRQKHIDEKKDEFVSIVSHELKSPFASVLAYSQLLQKHMMKAKDRKAMHMLVRMEDQLQRLNSLVNEMVDLSKIQANTIEYSMSLAHTDELVRDTVEDVQQTLSKHRILMKGTVTANILMDTIRISQVLTNLLLNAAKYSPGADEIIVRMRKSGNSVIISVQDFGIGVSPAHIGKIFNRYYRINENKNAQSNGMGLGLFISMQIIKHHKGTLTVKSIVGKGSTFSFSLPIAGSAMPKSTE